MQKKTDTVTEPDNYDVFSSDIVFSEEGAKSTPKESTKDGDTADLPNSPEGVKDMQWEVPFSWV